MFFTFLTHKMSVYFCNISFTH